MGKAQSFDTRKPWQRFEELIASVGGENRFRQTFSKARTITKSLAGDIYTLPESTYDFVSSYFVAESITTDKAECVRALTSLLKAVKPGGNFMVALMIGSKRWPAGEATHFPAVSLTLADIQHVFNDIPDMTVRVTATTDVREKAREGYHGMAIAIGSRNPYVAEYAII